ncbi:hypothetical protein HDV05_005265 [Chytridiales sp. JEL 0842]|nr:hypothetical protein HDV05_005265 [Chytridiales sp. JEL 0842]
MVVEEPSVVAAVSGAAKTISAAGGFTATTSERNEIFAQVQLLDIEDVGAAVAVLQSSKQQIIDMANSFVPNMVQRGGGVHGITVRTPERRSSKRPLRPNEVSLLDTSASSWLVVHLHLDVCDAMGANAASTAAEGVAPLLAQLTNGRIGLRIVSNLCTTRLAKASFRCPISTFTYKSLSGELLAARIIEAASWAEDDPYRAATHNKGIMNGVDAVAVATGQDWRAIEAAAHAWAAGCGVSDAFSEEDIIKTGRRYGEGYKPLTRYWAERDPNVADASSNLYLCGELELPISVGTKGGVLKTNPVYAYTLGIMGDPDSKTLAMAMVTVGLAQNFAALRALCSEGIQRGHMSLHARNIAIAAGAPSHAINECVAYMVESGRVNQDVAREYLMAHELHISLPQLVSEETKQKAKPPSTFYFEASTNSFDSSEEKLTLNVAFQTLGSKPVHLLLTPTSPHTSFMEQLLGERSHEWLTSTFALLDKIELNTTRPGRANRMLSKKLKLLSILLNLVVRGLMGAYPDETRRFIDNVINKVAKDSLGAGKVFRKESHLKPSPLGKIQVSATFLDGLKRDNTPTKDSPSHLEVARPLILALWQVFELRVLQWVGHQPLANELLNVQLKVLAALTSAPTTSNSTSPLREPPSLGDVPSASDSVDAQDDRGLEMNISKSSQAQKSVSLLRFFAFLPVHARRFQCSLFLLCDASTYDAPLLTAERLAFLKALGTELEHEQVLARDCGSRGLKAGKNQT